MSKNSGLKYFTNPEIQGLIKSPEMRWFKAFMECLDEKRPYSVCEKDEPQVNKQTSPQLHLFDEVCA